MEDSITPIQTNIRSNSIIDGLAATKHYEHNHFLDNSTMVSFLIPFDEPRRNPDLFTFENSLEFDLPKG